MTYTVQNYLYDYDKETRYSPVYQCSIQQLTLAIPGGGCVHYHAHKGDVCIFCGFPIFTRHIIKGTGYDNDYRPYTLPSDIYKEMYINAMMSTHDVTKVAIFNGGSFPPSSEVPRDFTHYVYEDIANRPHIQQLMVESFPNYITERALIEAKESLKSTDLMIGIGFESQDDRVRNTLLKKRIDKKIFEEKTRLMQALGVQVFVYVFLKAPGLDEGEAIADTLATIKYLHNLGVDEIALSCAFIPPGTDLEQQYHTGEFRPPWLWSVLYIMEKAAKHGYPLSVGGFSDNPKPIAGPSNCKQCDSTIHGIIDYYRLTGEYEPVTAGECDCYGDWEMDVEGVSQLRIL